MNPVDEKDARVLLEAARLLYRTDDEAERALISRLARIREETPSDITTAKLIVNTLSLLEKARSPTPRTTINSRDYSPE